MLTTNPPGCGWSAWRKEDELWTRNIHNLQDFHPMLSVQYLVGVAAIVAVTSSGSMKQTCSLNTCWVPGKVIQRKCEMIGLWPNFQHFLSLENLKTASITNATVIWGHKLRSDQVCQLHGQWTGRLGVFSVRLPNLLSGEGFNVLTTEPLTGTTPWPGYFVSWAQLHTWGMQGQEETAWSRKQEREREGGASRSESWFRRTLRRYPPSWILLPL